MKLTALRVAEDRRFRERLLGNTEVVPTLLRPEDAVAAVREVGALTYCEALFSAPLPAIGGLGALKTLERRDFGATA
jgi:hypothetical protein